MGILYEKYNDAAQITGTYAVWGVNQFSQSIQCAINNNISSFKVNLIRVGDCTGFTCTLALQLADLVTGKPSGVDVLTKSIDAQTVTDVNSMVEFAFPNTKEAGDDMWVFVVRLSAGDSSHYIGVNYDGDAPVYGGDLLKVMVTGDDAVTWDPHVDKDAIFEQYGIAIAPAKIEDLILTPGGVGDYEQLSPSSSGYDNYQMVDDPAGAPDDRGSYVVVGFEHFLTGICTWGNYSKVLSGDDSTLFSSELAVGYFVKRGGFKGNYCQVQAILTDKLVNFEDNFAAHKSGWLLEGTYDNNHAVSGNMEWQHDLINQYGIGTAFTTEFVIGDRVRNANRGGSGNFISKIEADNLAPADRHMVLGNHLGESGPPGQVYTGASEVAGIERAPQGEDPEGKTEYTAPTKRDCYILKETRSRGKILGVKVVFRIRPAAYVVGFDLYTYPHEVYNTLPVHATPFLRYGGVDDDGDQVELTPEVGVGESGMSVMTISEYADYEWIPSSVPGGGAWDWDKLNALQVGIELDMAIEYDNPRTIISRMECTQIYVVVTQEPPPLPDPDPEDPPGPDPEPPPPPKPPPIPPPFVCNDGEEKCIDFTLYRCVSNRWRFIEVRSVDGCNYKVPPLPLPDPDDVWYKGLTENGRFVHNGMDEYGMLVDDDMTESGYFVKEYWSTP